MNKSEYINKLKETSIKLDGLILMESLNESDENIEIGNKFLTKSEQDYNNIKAIEESVKAKIGTSVYNRAVNAGLKALKKKIMSVELETKKASKELDNKDKLLYYIERASDLIYQCLDSTVGAVYTLFTRREIKNETPETLSYVVLSLCPDICNSIASILLTQYFGYQKGYKMLSVLIAPLTEEYCKQVALRIGGSQSGMKYTMVFSGMEAADYVIKLYKFVGPRIFLYRFVAIIMHLSTTLIQHTTTVISGGKIRSFAFLVGAMTHSLYNAYGYELANFIDKVFPK